MSGERQFQGAGWIYLMATCIATKTPDHPFVNESIEWLKKNDYKLRAQTLEKYILIKGTKCFANRAP